MGARSSARAHSCRASNFDERKRDKITNVWHNGARRPDAARLSLRVDLLGSHLRRRVDFVLRQMDLRMASRAWDSDPQLPNQLFRPLSGVAT